jgi:sugar-phosphatase
MGSSEIPTVLIPCKGILFDSDGILISSLDSAERCWRKWAAMRGVDPDRVIDFMHGRRAIETVAAMCPDRDADAELKVIEKLEMDDVAGLTAMPGALELLRSLPHDRWTVVTSATVPLVRLRYAQVGIPIPDRMITAEVVTQGKPHPEPFLAGAALLGFPPEDCVVFEDAPSGARAGREAGCIVVATTFSHPADELEAANYLIKDLTEVTVDVVEVGLVLKLDQRVGRLAR